MSDSYFEMLDAQYPAAIFGNGFGDCLITLPALRALAWTFPNRLALICPPDLGRLFFFDLPLRVLCECEMPQTPAGKTFDADAAVDSLGACDLLLSLIPWHSADVERLLRRLSPTHSVGFFPAYQVTLPCYDGRHAADGVFDVPLYLNPSLRLEEFAAPPVFPERACQSARRMRSFVPPTARALVVHADTKREKMWPPERLVKTLDLFLERHPDFIVFVLGTEDLGLERGRYGKRVIPLYGLPIAVALAFVGEADLFLGVDSCMLHAADLFRVPGVGLYGPTDHTRWGFRFGPHRHIRNGDSMEAIDVEEVLGALESLACGATPLATGNSDVRGAKLHGL